MVGAQPGYPHAQHRARHGVEPGGKDDEAGQFLVEADYLRVATASWLGAVVLV